MAAECVEVSGNPNLFLLPGHIGLAEYETTLGIAQELSGSLLALRNLPGSLRYALDQTASKYQADYVLVDMSPSLGPINQNLLMTGDHFIVPLHPDYFSSMALSSLAKTLPRWKIVGRYCPWNRGSSYGRLPVPDTARDLHRCDNSKISP